ncbi:MFS transporter [Hydromonas duriensis]|uniref:Putative MFS family arabinose efflux permease n=1 Tax=Hydromonas duriensis TaxID=1527608 RepID=A0A4V3DJP0_9BURK|nr:MFS transporter [Hydromonas duriensis]TDR30893.1 putative MFS family arabinose efflux permease [Hydromonas duriensis]
MTMPKSPHPRTVQIALFGIFASFGVLVGLWAAAIPLLQKRLALSNDMIGLNIFCFGMGAVGATIVIPKLIARHNTRAVMRVAGCGMWLLFPLMIAAPSFVALMMASVCVGFCCGALDASMNSHAFNVEHHLQKPSLSLFHGGYSLGNILGSAAAALVLYLTLSYTTSVWFFSALALGAMWWWVSLCYPEDVVAQKQDSTTVHQRAPRALIIVAALTAISFFAEGAVGDWSGLFLRDIKSASATQTALSMAAFASGMTVARFLGDNLRARYATLPLLFFSSALASLMLVGFLMAPNAPLALLALVFAGLGYANLVPLLFVRAANIAGVPPARGVAFAAGMGYASLLGGPALLGYLAEHLGLATALTLVVFGTLLICFESRWKISRSKS